jgi:hypothetical protein
MGLYIIITTIQRPTASVERLVEAARKCDAQLVVAGDTKGPDAYPAARTRFLSYDDQLSSGFPLATRLPTKHYARKNVAYLYAIRSGATCIYETDDDNAPNALWQPRTEWLLNPVVVPVGKRWVNVYRYFSEELIWPRGLPLEEIRQIPPSLVSSSEPVRSPIQQGLVDNAPDVDAIWRLVLDRPFVFTERHGSHPIYLSPGNWSPFNTQSTWWWPVVYPLLYLPSYCSFRMCDIWKSFVAQRCLWELGLGVAFHGPEVTQQRNYHNLLTDFNDEVPGYLHNHAIASLLDGLTLTPNPSEVGNNLRTCYEHLVSHTILPPEELELVNLWLREFEQIPESSELV